MYPSAASRYTKLGISLVGLPLAVRRDRLITLLERLFASEGPTIICHQKILRAVLNEFGSDTTKF